MQKHWKHNIINYLHKMNVWGHQLTIRLKKQCMEDKKNSETRKQ